MAPDRDAPVDVVDVQFRSGSKIYYFDPGDLTVAAGDHVIIETARGPEYGTCAGGNHQVPFRDIVPPLRRVLRLATEADDRVLANNQAKEKRAFDICQQKILEHKLEMQLVSAEYAFDGSKILFFFTADDRVDFRELVKNLASIFRTRIELRQIGVRDKAKMVGGLGICGRPFCCAQFLDDFQPVSIKMAKTQNLSLNPTKISGTCGRLMCCLKYEQEAYEDLLKTSPKADSFVDTPEGRGTVVDVNLLRQSVKVRMEEQPDTIGCFHNCEICVLRNGKAKKNDPPVPADLAPISGGGKRPRKTMTDAEPPMHLDPIRFRYRPDDIVEEEQEAPREERRRRKKGDRKPEETPKPLREEPPEEGRPKSPRKPRGNKPKRPQPPATEEAAPKPRPKKPRGPKLRLEEQPEVINALPESSGQPKRNRRRRPAHPKRSQEGGAPDGSQGE
ncbi:MAG: hypothetical protein KHX25_02130 [Firmicutes bacterium]|nr:hypothetical protein [Bacillota bacterium]